MILSCSSPEQERIRLDSSDPLIPLLSWQPDEEELNLLQHQEHNRLAALFVITAGKTSTVPVGLRFVLKNDSLQVQPVLPLGEGMDFEWQVYAGADTIRYRFSTPAAKGKPCVPASVLRLLPEQDSIPSNILLFHLIFSAPMREDAQAFRHVRIVNKDGKTMPYAWRQKSAWTDSGRHLVLMIHPGRIKKGINYANASGPLFEPGNHYMLQTDDYLFTRSGDKAFAFTKKIYIVKPDHLSPAFKPVDHSTLPLAGSRQPLHILFTETMDYGSVPIGLSVRCKGNQVQGKFSRLRDDAWIFTPDFPWKSSTYSVYYSHYLADIASNHVDRLFEVHAQDEMLTNEKPAFNFTVK